MNIPITITRLEEIYDNYDAFILDQWGVIHDGEKGYLNAKPFIFTKTFIYKISSKLFVPFKSTSNCFNPRLKR